MWSPSAHLQGWGGGFWKIGAVIPAGRTRTSVVHRHAAGRRYWPISNSTLGCEVLPDVETLMEYSPAGSGGTVKFTWNCPGATSPANSTWASVVPIVTPTPVIGTGDVTAFPD